MKTQKITPEQIEAQKQSTLKKLETFNPIYFGKNIPDTVGVCLNLKEKKYAIFASYDN